MPTTFPIHDSGRPRSDPSAIAPAPLTVEYVRACCRTMWGRAIGSSGSKREIRNRMLDSLTWLSSKHGWTPEKNAIQVYQSKGLRVDGRLQLEMRDINSTVVVELCFDLQESTFLKLWAAHLHRKIPLLLWAGPPMPDSLLASKISSLLDGRPTSWLRFTQLYRQD